MYVKVRLRGTVSAMALILVSGTAFAQDWQPTATNTGPVVVGGDIVGNENNTITDLGSLTGDGASASISGVGASASVSTTTISPDTLPGTVLGFTDAGFPDITTTATNTAGGVITNEGNEILFNDGQTLSGAASSVSLGATGAGASVGWTGIATPDLEVNGSGAITQNATNQGTVTLRDGSIATDGTALFTLTGPASAAAASATGASASVMVRAIASNDFGMATDASIGNIDQTVLNDPSGTATQILNAGTEIASGVLEGTASSVSVGGTGASASVGTSVVGSDSFGGVEIGSVIQNVTSQRGVQTTGSSVTTGDLEGSGTLASISAGGALASVGESFVESSVVGGSIVGDVNQTSAGNSNAWISRAELQTGEVFGNSASARISATGAAANVSSSAIESVVADATQFGTVTQEVSSTAGVNMRTGPGRTVTTDDLSGDGASASISGTAAAASVSASLVDTTSASAMPSFGAIDQQATSTAGITAGNNQVTTQDLTGTAAGAQVSLTGATTSVSASLVNAQRLADGGASFDTITSRAERTGSAEFVVGETGSGTPSANTVTTGDLIGNAASASISATGASASVSETMLSVGTEPFDARNTSGRIETTALNESGILHANSSVTTGELEGAATSARIGTTGAAASFSSTAVDGVGRSMLVSDGLAQSATNQGDLTTRDASVIVGTAMDPVDVSGNAASAGISTVGASMSVSSTKVDVIQGPFPVINGGIAQSGSNEGAVALSDSGVIVGNVSGAAASASAGATGLSASISVSSIGSEGSAGANQLGLRAPDPIWQGNATTPLTNSGAVSVTDVSISTGDISGPAASAGISARGATGSVSSSSIATTNAAGGSASFLGGINQYITNDAAGAVSISGGNIAAGGISGTGASASISAVGASAGVSVSTIVADSVVEANFNGPITQTVVNNAPVTHTGSAVNVGGNIGGNGASAGISAVGASASIGFSTIN